MRLRLQASPEELRDKGPALVEALVAAVFPGNPELAEQLEKALPPREPSLKYPALRELHRRSARAYREQLDAMRRDIGEVLDRSAPLAKGMGDVNVPARDRTLEKAGDHTKAIAEADAVAYERLKEVLKRTVYTAADFEEGGRLYGKSVNELLELARERKAG